MGPCTDAAPLHFNILLVSSAISHQSVDILTEKAETVASPSVNHFNSLGQEIQQMLKP